MWGMPRSHHWLYAKIVVKGVDDASTQGFMPTEQGGNRRKVINKHTYNMKKRLLNRILQAWQIPIGNDEWSICSGHVIYQLTLKLLRAKDELP